MRTLIVIAGLLLTWSVLRAEVSLPDFICSDVSDASERSQCIDKAQVATRHDRHSSGTSMTWYSGFWPVGWWIAYYAFGVLIGSHIRRDATSRSWLFLGIRPIWWAVLAVFEPAFGLLVYWALHYSRFARSYAEANPAPGEGPVAPSEL